MTLRFPASVDAQQFLAEYWQRKPLFIPSGLAGLLPDLSPAELAGLACDDDAEARLLRCSGPPSQWQLQHGPFDDSDFATLPESHWTLLVQDVDKCLPDVATLLDQFSFIPRWRIDDVMISYATAGGTVGPHIDEYDVFLIQGEGSRTWQVGSSNGNTVADSPVRVLEEFAIAEQWHLTTGDVLYLPPGLAHHGHADQASMTFSVGFRAPSAGELMLSQAAYRAEQTSGRYQDHDLLQSEADDGLISTNAVQRALALTQNPLESIADATMWFGQLVTENKPWLQAIAPQDPESQTQFNQRLHAGNELQKHPGVRMAHSHQPAFGILFVDGLTWPLTAHNRAMAPLLCRGQLLHTANDHADCGHLLYQLYCEGKIYWAEDD